MLHDTFDWPALAQVIQQTIIWAKLTKINVAMWCHRVAVRYLFLGQKSEVTLFKRTNKLEFFTSLLLVAF